MPLLTELENLFLTGGYRDFAPTALCRRFSVAAGIPACRGAGASCPAEKTLAHTHRAEKFQNVIPLSSLFPGGGTLALYGRRDVHRYNTSAAFPRCDLERP